MDHVVRRRLGLWLGVLVLAVHVALLAGPAVAEVLHPPPREYRLRAFRGRRRLGRPLATGTACLLLATVALPSRRWFPVGIGGLLVVVVLDVAMAAGKASAWPLLGAGGAVASLALMWSAASWNVRPGRRRRSRA